MNGYESLSVFRPEDIIDVHDEAAKHGYTWSFEIRERGSIEYLADRIRRMAKAKRAPKAIAALAMHFVVREHPFWDANHRTGFELAQIVLRAFGLVIESSPKETEEFVRSIDRDERSLRSVENWVKTKMRRLR